LIEKYQILKSTGAKAPILVVHDLTLFMSHFNEPGTFMSDLCALTASWNRTTMFIRNALLCQTLCH